MNLGRDIILFYFLLIFFGLIYYCCCLGKFLFQPKILEGLNFIFSGLKFFFFKVFKVFFFFFLGWSTTHINIKL